MTTLVLIRHAQTDSNVSGPNPLMSGWTDLPLNAVGLQQASQLRKRWQHETPVAAVYSSPLTRAQETAAAVEAVSANSMGLVPELREINCGHLDGRPVSQVQREHPELWQRNLEQNDDDFRWPGGESYRELRQRCLRALHQIAARHPDERVAVVTHAGVISQVLGWIHGFRPARWEAYRPQNTSLTLITWERSDVRLLTFDDHRHLDGLREPASMHRHGE